MKRYEIWLATFPKLPDSHVQAGRRPAVIISNDLGNSSSEVVTVVPLTTKCCKPHLPTHVYLRDQGLDYGSIALCEQSITLDRPNLIRRIGYVHKSFDRLALMHAICIQLGLVS